MADHKKSEKPVAAISPYGDGEEAGVYLQVKRDVAAAKCSLALFIMASKMYWMIRDR